jgi:hypothetical protein
MKKLQRGITEGIRLSAANFERIRDATWRAALYPTGRHDPHRWAIADFRITTRQRFDQSFVFVVWNAGTSSNAAICFKADTKDGA